MDSDQYIWRDWANNLHRWGVNDWVASLLEAMGSLTILGAQLVYLSQPLLDHALPEERLSALARVLEDAGRSHEFIELLREAPPP